MRGVSLRFTLPTLPLPVASPPPAGAFGVPADID